jgi:release factor glutamine methyltransferase
MTSIAETLAAARIRLAAAGVDSAALDARLLLGATLGVSQATLVGWPERPVPPLAAAAFAALLERRVLREPVAFLLGRKEFWGLEFLVSRATLIPRPDSETLVAAALDRAGSLKPACFVLDIGTGTGCLLISVLHALPTARGAGIDVVPAALDLAARNAETHGVAGRITWHVGSLPLPADVALPEADIVLANLPYIPRAALPGLAPDVAAYEPLSALVGGEDGLDVFRLVLPCLPFVLRCGGRALFEVGVGQADAVERLAAAIPGLVLRRRWPDLAGIDRVIEWTRA